MKEKLKFSMLPLPAGMACKDPVALIATWFGAGLIRPAPGTMGSLAAIPFGYIIAMTGGMVGLVIAALLLLIISTIAADRFGKKSGTVDDQCIVVDEVVGLWIAAIPAGTDIVSWIAAFLLFRLFDVWKPWPASFFDKRSKNGFGVMMDDVVAGIYAFLGVAVVALRNLNMM